MPDTKPWYQNGLRFDCTRCGNCCGGAPGNVYVSEAEVDAIADRLGIDREAFLRRYTRVVHRADGDRFSLVEHKNHDCIFFVRGKGCSIYEDRPRQCRTWPFWRANLLSQEEWDAEAEDCPGMGRGELVDGERIQAIAADDGLP
ncbi:MAG: YkgJ family cysteine cluster protein [Planctomycetota bacterium]|jgi:Fe-S-cluster containining protein|nr:YkgJ family cysteine cluster protein [Planctomycetota bacterium]